MEYNYQKLVYGTLVLIKRDSQYRRLLNKVDYDWFNEPAIVYFINFTYNYLRLNNCGLISNSMG